MKITKLEAVNMMLDAIGEDPVSSLTSGLPDAEKAERVLDETCRDVQAVGWHCNTEFDYELTPTVSGELVLPNNTLRIDASALERFRIDVVERAGRLYDRKNKTYTFARGVQIDLVVELPFEDLPYRLAFYIAKEASGRFEKSALGNGVVSKGLAAEIAEARARLQADEEEVDDANVLRDSRDVAMMTFRNSRKYHGWGW